MKSEKSRNIKQSEAGNGGWLELKFISNPLESRGAKRTGGCTSYSTAQHAWYGMAEEHNCLAEKRRVRKGWNWGGNQAWDFLRNPIDR